MKDRTPPADRIFWKTPAPSPLDALAASDETSGLRLAYSMLVTYRELLQTSLAANERQTVTNQRLIDQNKHQQDQLRDAHAEIERLRAELVRK